VMEVGMPQAADVLDLVAADLARGVRRVDAIGSRTIPRGMPPLTERPCVCM
jgi:hypothetical protein